MNRKLKIGYNTRSTGLYNSAKTKFFPKIVIQGNWLEKAGFRIGEHTQLTIENGKIEIIIIEPAT